MIPIESQNLEHLKKFLSSPYEVNQELGIATLKAVGIPEKKWQDWHKLMSTSIQKLRFCLQYGFDEELRIVRLTDFSLAERAYLSIIESFPNLEALYLSDQAYLDYDWILDWSKIPNLKTLSLVRNELRQFPASIARADQLERLYLSHNRLLKVDALIGNLQSLRVLSLRRNRLKNLPSQLGSLKSLAYLDVSHNYLKTWDRALCALPNLEELNLAYNRLEALPEELSRLRRLKVLNISGNKIEELPETLLELPRLEVLKIKSTPLARDQDFIYYLQEQKPHLRVEY
jgi:Leucine-rich repeat (LRR) protein